MTHTAWILIGLLGQACYFSRFLLQWIASERAKKSVVPRIFWHLSLAGALCVLSYALYRNDPVFVLSVLPGAFIYTRNLLMRQPTSPARLTPIAVALVAFIAWAVLANPYVDHLFWAGLGLAGSLVWSSRFVVQWWASERKGEPTLPVAFWVMSLIGNILLLAYSIYRKDPVFIPGQSIGYLVYSRNLYLILRERRETDGHGEKKRLDSP